MPLCAATANLQMSLASSTGGVSGTYNHPNFDVSISAAAMEGSYTLKIGGNINNDLPDTDYTQTSSFSLQVFGPNDPPILGATST